MPARLIRNPRPATFLGAPLVEDLAKLDAQVGMLGVPYDYGMLTPGNRQGIGRQSRGPQAVRNAIVYRYVDLLTGAAAGGRYDVQDDAEYLKGVTMADCGDVNIIPGADVRENFDRMTEVARQIDASGALVAAIGGDHSISYPICRGMERHGPIDVVLFDAHADFADELNGSKLSHASNLRRQSELTWVEQCSMVGLRVVTKQDYLDAREHGVKIVTSRRLTEIGAERGIAEVMRPGKKVYLSIDVDILDVGILPDTSYAEPDGITFRLLEQSLWALASRCEIVGFDICELCGDVPSGSSARVTAWILVRLLSAITSQPTWPRRR